MRSWLSHGQLFKTHKTCLLHRRYHFVKISNREHAVWILHSIKNRCQYNVVLFSTFFPLLLSVRTALTDMSTLTSDLPTLLGVTSGIAVLAGLICMVLHLFSKTRYPRHRNFTDTNLPPILYSSDTGKMTVETVYTYRMYIYFYIIMLIISCLNYLDVFLLLSTAYPFLQYLHFGYVEHTLYSHTHTHTYTTTPHTGSSFKFSTTLITFEHPFK